MLTAICAFALAAAVALLVRVVLSIHRSDFLPNGRYSNRRALMREYDNTLACALADEHRRDARRQQRHWKKNYCLDTSFSAEIDSPVFPFLGEREGISKTATKKRGKNDDSDD